MSALLMQQGQNTVVNGDAFSKQLFSLLDTNSDGTISKSEFETAFQQNGNTTQADSIFAKLDANSDGSVDPNELLNALNGGQDQSQGMQGMPHHHHHHGGMGGMGGMGDTSASGGASASGSSGSSGSGDPMADALLQADGNSQTVTNSDGSSTTTLTYADGSTVSMTTPAAGSSGSNASANNNFNFIERMIQRQAQLLASANAGQSVAVSA
jgi:hypothetical protein